MAIYVTGDKHQNYRNLLTFIEFEKLTENDTILVLGDMGLFWRKDRIDSDTFIDYYEKNYKCNLWFIDGNHENFDQLEEIKIIDGYGNISPHIKWLPRGNSYTWDNKKILVIGGADSVDKMFRTEHLSWWEQEQITDSQADEIIKKYKGQHFDYVFTHATPRKILDNNVSTLTQGIPDLDQSKVNHTSEDNLQRIADNISFDNWWFGHYHNDIKIDDKFRCFYHEFEKID